MITVPAFFDEGRRRMTQDAGRLAGLEVLDIINEPTAAAIAFGRRQGFLDPASQTAAEPAQRLLVYDLGGGTFDVTVLEIDGTRFRTLATDGDVRLGGKDFDKRLVDHLAEQFCGSARHRPAQRSPGRGTAVAGCPGREARSIRAQQDDDRALPCRHPHADRGQPQRVRGNDRRPVGANRNTASLVIRQAGLEWQQIDRVLLVGGATRMPMVRNMLRELSGKEPDCSQSPDEAVAHGAALYAGELLARESGSPQSSCELINVNSHSLGVVGIEVSTGHRKNVILIPKNTPLPARASRVFKTARANQRSVRVRVVEGESDRPEDCIALGECVVRELPPGLPPKSDIEVEYAYAANGRISVVARVPSVRYSAQVEIQRSQPFSSDDLRDMAGQTYRHVGSGQRIAVRRPPATSTVDLTDRESVRKRMDTLLMKVGRAALRCRVPEQLAASQSTALSSAAEVAEARRVLKSAQQSADATLHDPAVLQHGAGVTKAKTAFEQARVRADFTCLVLGRECVEKEFVPPRSEREVRELFQLAAAAGPARLMSDVREGLQKKPLCSRHRGFSW